MATKSEKKKPSKLTSERASGRRKSRTTATERVLQKSRPPLAAASWPTYTIKNQFPAGDADMLVVFRGLQYFFFNTDPKLGCQVGMHNDSPAGQKHEFSIKSWTKQNQVCPASSTPLGKVTSSVEITVVQPIAAVDGVYVFESGSFNRMVGENQQNPNYKRDFRWIVDFENPAEFYGVGGIPVKKYPGKLSPILHINNGIFHTLYRTKSDFSLRQEGNTPRDGQFGFTAGIIGAYIYLGNNGRVDVSIDGKPPIPFQKQAGVSYQLDVTNDCRSLAACGYDPKLGGNKQKRNDFYLHYRVFDAPSGRPELGLVCKHVLVDGKAGICPGSRRDTTDAAPCVGGVFGLTSTIP